jgi:hypothetical protein
MRWEANCTLNERLRERRQRRQTWSTTQAATRAWGDDTLSEPESLEEDEEHEEEEGEVILLPPNPLCKALPLLGDIFHRQAGTAIDARQPKQTWAETGPSAGSLPQTCLTLVALGSRG